MLGRLVTGAIAAALAWTPAGAAQGTGAGAAQDAPVAPAAARQDYEPKPALWLLEDADTKIYLFGTFHILPPGFRWRTARFDEVASRADSLVLETVTPPGDPMAGQDAIVERYFMTSVPVPILKRVERKHRKVVGQAIASSGLPAEAYSFMQTWAVGFMLLMEEGMEDFGGVAPDAIPGVEDQLEASLRAAGKPIGAIEDGDAVAEALFGFFARMPAAEQRAMLVEAATEVVRGEDAADDLSDLHDWARGRADGLANGFEEMPEAMYDILITRRNAAWTDWLAKRLEQPGTTLLAVGAGHLAGPGSVQELLAKRGLVASRIQ